MPSLILRRDQLKIGFLIELIQGKIVNPRVVERIHFKVNSLTARLEDFFSIPTRQTNVCTND